MLFTCGVAEKTLRFTAPVELVPVTTPGMPDKLEARFEGHVTLRVPYTRVYKALRSRVRDAKAKQFQFVEMLESGEWFRLTRDGQLA